MLTPGSIVANRFRIERILGEGGMGQVAVAMHLELEQRVALKVLHERGATDPAALERFAREARSAARLRGEHVCRVFDVGRLDDGAPFIVMELLEGMDLATLAARGPLSIAVAVDHVLQACVAVAEAHHAGIIHRDLKPANLFLTRRIDGSSLIKVLDFGIAKATATVSTDLTRTATLIGSPGYMSPEQLRSSRDVDARSDLWSLGVILYELVAGYVPFPAETLTELAVKIAMDPPRPVDFDPAFAAVVLRCLEKAPRDRYRTVAELAIALAPFGGPKAAAVAESIQRLADPATDPLATTMAHVATDAPTASSLATSRPGHLTTLQSATGVQTPVGAPPGRTPWTAIAIGSLAVSIAVVGIVAMTRPRREVPELRGSTQAIAIPLANVVPDDDDVVSATAAAARTTAEPPATPGTVAPPAAPATAEPAPAMTARPSRPDPKPNATNRATSRVPAKDADPTASAAPPAAPPVEPPAEPIVTGAKPNDDLVAIFDKALREGRCSDATNLLRKLVRRDGDLGYTTRVQTCLKNASKEDRVAWYVEEAQDRMGSDLTGALQLAQAALAEDPRNTSAARMAVYIACFNGDADMARKYIPALSEEGRHDMERLYYCQLLKIKFD